MNRSPKDLIIAPYEKVVAINVAFLNDGVRCGYLFVERYCPAVIALDGVNVTLPPEAVMQRNPLALTEIILELAHD